MSSIKLSTAEVSFKNTNMTQLTREYTVRVYSRHTYIAFIHSYIHTYIHTGTVIERHDCMLLSDVDVDCCSVKGKALPVCMFITGGPLNQYHTEYLCDAYHVQNDFDTGLRRYLQRKGSTTLRIWHSKLIALSPDGRRPKSQTEIAASPFVTCAMRAAMHARGYVRMQ